MPKPHQKFNLKQVVVCDDIRREDSGKFILIGVYPEGIALPKIPETLFLSLWLDFQLKLIQETTLEVKITGDALNDNELIFKPIHFSEKEMLNQELNVPVILTKIKLAVERTGQFSIYYCHDGNTWKLATKINIVQQTNN